MHVATQVNLYQTHQWHFRFKMCSPFSECNTASCSWCYHLRSPWIGWNSASVYDVFIMHLKQKSGRRRSWRRRRRRRSRRKLEKEHKLKRSRRRRRRRTTTTKKEVKKQKGKGRGKKQRNGKWKTCFHECLNDKLPITVPITNSKVKDKLAVNCSLYHFAQTIID